MIQENTDRRLPGWFTRLFFRAVGEQLGNHSLHTMLRLAGLDRYIHQLSSVYRQPELLSSEYARCQEEIRAYYGRGARGSLNRIGQRIFQWRVKEAPLLDKIYLLGLRMLPATVRRKRCLDWLARQLRESDGQISVHTLDLDLIFVLHTSDSACGQSADEPICWVTQGMIQEALRWATDEEADVEEISCRAVGGEPCTFTIHVPGVEK